MMVRPNLCVLLLTGIACLAMSACSEASAVGGSVKQPDVKVEAAKDAGTVTVSHPEAFQLVTANPRHFTETVDATGSVAADVSRTVPVLALSSGRVVDIRARLGDEVQSGQVLLTMASPDMSQAISDHQKFQTDLKLAKTQLDRAELLFSKGSLARKELETAQDVFDKAEVDARTAAERIRILGGDPAHPTSLIAVTAPTSGTIIEQNVTAAGGVKSLDNSPNLFTIADLSRLWVLCDVYENDLGRLGIGDQADIELNAYPGRTFHGRVSNISKLLDPNTRSAKVRIELPNESGLLRTNMFATVHFTTQSSSSRLVIPSTAVLRLQDRDWVFVKVGDHEFRKIVVQAGPVDAKQMEQILSGLQAGQQVVLAALTFDREVNKE